MPDVSATWLRGCRVLVAEDEYFIASEIAHVLGNFGAVVVGPTSTVEGARRFIEAGEIDAAILDINLRGQPVYPIADLMRSRDLPFVFATGYDLAVIPARYADMPRCEKPLSAAVVAALLARLLEGRAAPVPAPAS